MNIRHCFFRVCAIFATALLMSHRFICTEACGRSFPEPRRLSRHQDVCQVWKQHCIEQRRQVLLLSRSDPESCPGVNPPSPKRQRLEGDQDPVGTGDGLELPLAAASNDGPAGAPSSSQEQVIRIVSCLYSLLKRKSTGSHEANSHMENPQWP